VVDAYSGDSIREVLFKWVRFEIPYGKLF